MEFNHVSVLLNETVDSVVTNPDGIYVDCTLGGAGHAHAVGERLSSQGMIIGLDQDEDALTVETTVVRFILSGYDNTYKFFEFKTCFRRARYL